MPRPHSWLGERGFRGGPLRVERPSAFQEGRPVCNLQLSDHVVATMGSIGVFGVERMGYRADNDTQIKQKAPVPKIVEIMFDSLLDAGISPPSIYLRPSRDTNLEVMSSAV